MNAGYWIIVSAIPFVLVFLSLLLMRTLWLPRTGCWLLYLTTLIGLFLVLVGGLLLVGVATLIQHILKAATHKDLPAYVAGGLAVVLMFLGKKFLEARNWKPFQAMMKWFLKRSFTQQVGAVNPLLPAASPRQLAFRAVFDDAYGGDPRYGTVQGWGVRACCIRLMQIKFNH
ncbi:MAG TPA: hypothetical protein VNX26_07670 [Candidatus Acidoferrum sp.]|jgi:hypothetical protein|nr:hypothetical protein [Candidatus Acidoferrum sp.]